MKPIFMRRFLKKIIKAGLIIIGLLVIFTVAINIYISSYSKNKIYTKIKPPPSKKVDFLNPEGVAFVAHKPYLCNAQVEILFLRKAFIHYHLLRRWISKFIKDVPYAYTVLVPGSLVYCDSSLSLIVKDRVDKAIELYKAEKIKRILVSGDHGTKKYDEVNCIKKYLKEQGIPEEDIFTDHAGFDTYSSIVRANKVFKVDSMIIVSQEYHLRRALYIADKKDLTAYGYVSDKRTYPGMRSFKLREYLANVKAFFYVLFNTSPHFLGPEIPITGDSKKSYD